MDSEGYRKAQSPWFFTRPDTYAIEQQARRVNVPKVQTEPTRDSRYPGWAAPMNDARLVTDYRSKCEVNIPTGMQFATKKFLQKNATSLIDQSRKRQAERSGAGLAYNSVVEMPPALYVQCNEYECSVKQGSSKGIGIQRMNETTPELFGTFAESRSSVFVPSQPMFTTKQEGGRNTVRGIFS